MEQYNLQPDDKDQHQPSALMVRCIGFNGTDEESFKRFFQVSRIGQRKYTAANPSDIANCPIIIVNYDEPTALAERNGILAAHPHIQVVAVSRGPLEPAPPHHIRGMLFAARVLTTLDKIPLELESKTETAHNREPISAFAEPKQPEGTLENQALPVAPEVTQIIPQPTIPVTPPVTAVTAGYRALVVDDSIAIQKSIELNLAALSQITVIDFADSGELALEKAEATRYDLIFLDVMMPGIDGYETCTRLRKKPEYKKTPIIMVSGKTSPLDEVKGVMAGCTTYLTKPVQKEAFQKLGTRVLGWLEKLKTP